MGTRTILVVEDDLVQARSWADLLRLWGYEAELAFDGVEALTKVASTSPSLVIADLRMPRLSGLGLLRELRDHFPGVRCILISGQSTLDEAIEGIGLGAYRFLEKPVDPARLQLEIRSCLRHYAKN